MRSFLASYVFTRWLAIAATLAVYVSYKNTSLSADGLISAAVSATIAWMTIFNIFCEYIPEPDAHNQPRAYYIFCDFCHRENRSMNRLVFRIYELRWVFFFVLAALFVSAIAPVSSFMEIQQNITSSSCTRLAREELLVGGSIEDCLRISDVSGSQTVGNATGGLKNHFIQIAMWPLVLWMYGMISSFLIWLPQKLKGLTLEQSVARLSHGSHGIKLLLAILFGAISAIQDALGI